MHISKISIGIAVSMSAAGVVTATAVTGNVDASSGPDVVIAEVMIDPQDVYDSRGEWIELANHGDAPAQLAGWTITDGRLERAVLPDLTLAPGDQIVLARHADPFVNGGAEPDWVYGNQIVLYNPSDRLILTNADGVVEDRVDWYPGTGLQAPQGRSLSRRQLDADPSDPASWCASTTVMVRGDLGSPGGANVCDAPAEPLVITEILQNPKRSSDASGEWFELYNPGTAPVDAGGWTVKDDDRDRFTIDTALVVPAGGYVVLGNGAVANGGVTPDTVYGSLMMLQNDSDELVVADARGILVDRVAWDNGRTFPDPDGASMSLLDPAADNAKASSWCTATSSWALGDRGTPQAPSWCTAAGTNPIVVTEVMFDPETPASERASEWFEIANLGTAAVDLTGWTITAGDYKVHTIAGLVVQPGSLAVLAASGDPVANGGITPQYVYGTSPDLPLYNTTGRVILKNTSGSIIDRVEWSPSRSFPMPSGASITLGFPTVNNELGTNWCASNARWGDGDFGTPGSVGTCEAPPAPPAVMISEVLRNPAATSDSNGEWFEVYNAGSTDVDIAGWSIGDGASDHHVIRTGVVVPAGGFAVLARTADATINGGAPAAYAYGAGFVLSNDADRIVLRDRYDQTVDDVRWAKDDGMPRPNGASLARTADGWCVSGPQFGAGDLGTPGNPNDCTPLPHLDVVISEVQADPAAVSDTVGEWIEITNNTAQPVDLQGWRIRDDDADQHTITRTLVVAAGESVVLGRDTADALNGGAGVDYAYGSAFPLTDAEDEITLLDSSLVWVDRVTWTAARPFPVGVGASAALRGLTLDNSDAVNWCTSVTTYGSMGEHGTPGAANVCEIVEPEPTTTTTTTVPDTTTTTTTVPEETTTTVVDPASTTTLAPEITTTTTPSQPATTVATPTTTTIPSGSGQPFGNGWVVLTLADRACGNGLQLSGSKIDIRGAIRSNGNVMLQGSDVEVDGSVSYAGTKNISNKVQAAHVVQSTDAVASGLPFTVADFAPGGRYSVTPNYAAHSGNWSVNSAAAGIHYVSGNVTISASSLDLRGVTIVATGTVTISGSDTRLAPASPDLPAVLAGGGSCTATAVNISGSKTRWDGVIAAPNGGVQINGSEIRGGTVIGANVQMSGSDLRIG